MWRNDHRPVAVAGHVVDLELGVHAAPSYLQRAGTPAPQRELERMDHRIVGFRWGRTGKPLALAMHRGDESITVPA